MPSENELAPYAIALLSVAKEEGKVPIYLEEVRKAAKLFASSPTLLKALGSYAFPYERKEALLESFFIDSEALAFLPFLKVLVKRHIISSFANFARLFETLANETLGIKQGIVYSSRPLSETEVETVENAIGDKAGCRVFLENRIDQNLIGGVKVAIDGRIYDGSLEGKIERLRHTLLKGESL